LPIAHFAVLAPMTKVLQTTEANVKQKKTQRPMPKLGESVGTKHTFKP